MKQYRIVGKSGQWGEPIAESYKENGYLEQDLEWVRKRHPNDTFHVEVREVSEWERLE